MRTPDPTPHTLWVVRHGQSAGNVARDRAEAERLAVIDIAERDIDTPLSDLGRAQAAALGHWFGAMPPAQQPDVVLVSPYLRALDTARIVLDTARIAVPLRQDERLREKEFGVVDRLTHIGIADKFPDLHAQRAHVGKFYFRPPGGESWCDVILRLRSVVEMATREYEGRRVLVVAHQVIVNCLRYVLEGLDEAQILAIDREGDVPNCGVTAYRFDAEGMKDGRLHPVLANFTAPLRDAGAPVTAAPDVPVAPKP